MKKVHVRIKFGDILIFALILGVGIFLCTFLFKSHPQETVKIQAINTTYQYPLSKDGEYKIPGAIGITTVQVKNGHVKIIDSPCPNKTCMQQNFGNTIICLPNNVIVSIEDDGGFDAIAE